MNDKILIFIPYQDSDNFYSDGILTREFAILYMLYKYGYTTVLNIKKPRTILDKKRYVINESFYPEGTIENYIKEILDKAQTIQYLSIISARQLVHKRGWWSQGYMKVAKRILDIINGCKECLVYSDNPYAAQLLKELKNCGCKIYFDVMDNFAIHPSLNKKEKQAALTGYRSIFNFSDIVSANSQQTCEYMNGHGAKDIILVKNGVFLNNETVSIEHCDQIVQLEKKKTKYSQTAGYIGKLGKRLDAKLIERISRACKDTLFVFVGPYLEGQINNKLISLFKQNSNVVHLEGIPSAYIYTMLNQFDILMIPHAVGENENGGDPLKLYQYLTRKKPIITTPILGVDEFADIITITSDVSSWVKFINSKQHIEKYIEMNFDWKDRLAPVMKVIE